MAEFNVIPQPSHSKSLNQDNCELPQSKPREEDLPNSTMRATSFNKKKSNPCGIVQNNKTLADLTFRDSYFEDEMTKFFGTNTQLETKTKPNPVNNDADEPCESVSSQHSSVASSHRKLALQKLEEEKQMALKRLNDEMKMRAEVEKKFLPSRYAVLEESILGSSKASETSSNKNRRLTDWISAQNDNKTQLDQQCERAAALSITETSKQKGHPALTSVRFSVGPKINHENQVESAKYTRIRKAHEPMRHFNAIYYPCQNPINLMRHLASIKYLLHQ